MMQKMRNVLALCLACLLLPLASANAETEFLVGDEEQRSSGSLWVQLFGVEEEAAVETNDKQDAQYRATLQKLLDGSVVDAVNDFARLGTYRDSVKLTDYANAMIDYLRGDVAAARAGFEALDGFGDAAYRVELCDLMAIHRVYQNGKFGYANLKGETVIAPAYDWAERTFREESRVAGHGEDSLKPVAVVFSGTTRVEEGEYLPDVGKYGLLGADGELVAPMEYDEVLWTENGLAALRVGQSRVLLNLLSGERIGMAYDDVKAYREGYVPVKLTGKWSFLNAKGEYVPGGFVWDDAEPFSEGLAVVAQGGKYGFINTAGTVKIALEYQDAHSFGEGLAGVRWKKRYGFIDANGNVVLENQYADTGVFSQGACRVQKGKKYGLIDSKGTLITKYKYDEITDFDPVYHRAWIRINQVWGLVSSEGTVVLTPTWGSYTPFGANGMSRVSYRKKYGYINTMGVMMILSKYTAAAPFAAGRGGVVSAGGQVEYLDRFGRGFTVDSAVPTEAQYGFLEGRKYVSYSETDSESGAIVTKQKIAFRLYQVDGTPITDWAE